MIVLIILLLLIIIVDQFHINSLYKDINILYDDLEEINHILEKAANGEKINID